MAIFKNWPGALGAFIFALVFFWWHEGARHLNYIDAANASAYDVAMAHASCSTLSDSRDDGDFCDLGPLRWVRLDSAFYRPPNNVYPTDRHRLANVLIQILALKPRILAVDVRTDGGGARDPVYKAVASYLQRCQRGPCVTKLIFSRTLLTSASEAVWDDSVLQPLEKLDPSHRYLSFAHIDFDEASDTGFGRTMRPVESGCSTSSSTHCSQQTYLSLPYAVAEAYNGSEPGSPTNFRGPVSLARRYIDYAISENVVSEDRRFSISAASLAAPSLDTTGMIRNAAVIVGASSDGLGALRDVYATPLGTQPGVIMLLNGTNTVFHGGLHGIPEWGMWGIWLLLVAVVIWFQAFKKMNGDSKVLFDLGGVTATATAFLCVGVLLRMHFLVLYVIFPITIIVAGVGDIVGDYLWKWLSKSSAITLAEESA